MLYNSKTLRNSRGMTLVEVMMALAVFGIILLCMTQMTTAGIRITAVNDDQIRMTELAQAEAEKIKSDPGLYPTDPGDLNKSIDYPPGSSGADVERTYAILYQKDANGMLKITVGPFADASNPDPLDINNSDNYVLVTWLP